MLRIALLFFTIVSVTLVVYSTPLDDYVNKPDPAYSWRMIQTNPYSTYTVYILNLTSQNWFDVSFSTQSLWWHYMYITVPKTLRRSKTAFMRIGDGSNTDPIPKYSFTTTIAMATGSVAIELLQIPNQPITFTADPKKIPRTEDSIISWLWRVFIESNGSDPNILLRLPMTKAAVRGMDATQEFLRQQQIEVPETFIIEGASKRGWTTWTTAAVDNKRVIAAIPLVLDMVNLREHMQNHYRSLAGWTYAFYDYYMENITRNLDNPYFQVMANIIDPYVYFNRYQHIKILQFQAADDHFFPPNSEDFFWDDLQKATGGSFLRRIPNMDHGIWGYNDSLASFYMSVYDNVSLPLWSWARTINETHGQIRANVSITDGHPAPLNVTVYQARTVNGTKRDFRLIKMNTTTGKKESNPIKWIEMNNIEISHIDQSIIYTYITPTPPNGYWDGIFMQATFPGSENIPLELTTETMIIPNTYPVDPCQGEQCYGTLV